MLVRSHFPHSSGKLVSRDGAGYREGRRRFECGSSVGFRDESGNLLPGPTVRPSPRANSPRPRGNPFVPPRTKRFPSRRWGGKRTRTNTHREGETERLRQRGGAMHLHSLPALNFTHIEKRRGRQASRDADIPRVPWWSCGTHSTPSPTTSTGTRRQRGIGGRRGRQGFVKSSGNLALFA